jgi:hypothetical protein
LPGESVSLLRNFRRKVGHDRFGDIGERRPEPGKAGVQVAERGDADFGEVLVLGA